MGCGFSSIASPSSKGLPRSTDTPEQARKRVLTKLNAEAEKKLSKARNSTVQRALFLGTGESGKSTVFKQLRLNYAKSYDSFERYQYSKLIWIDTIRMARILMEICDEKGRGEWFDFSMGADRHIAMCRQLLRSLDLSRQALLKGERDPRTRDYLGSFQMSSGGHDGPLGRSPVMREPIIESAQAALTEDMQVSLLPAPENPRGAIHSRQAIAAAVRDIWAACPGDLKQMVRANKLDGMETNAAYFLDKISTFCNTTYLANDEDILRARIKTTGINSARFNVKGTDLVVLDVGGQRVERRKWIYGFDDVTTLLFVVAVSEFDQPLFEDKRVNRLDEAMAVFEQVVNSQWFRSKSVTLFFNKTDILEEKVRISNFSRYYPDFKGNNRSAEEVLKYIESMFRRCIKLGDRNLYIHRTCATDKTSMTFVMSAVTDAILYENLRWAGMI